ncbi:unnamed protein product [Dicrocoelium dendriticum]|nr:unnamed protein product [Dicrocoelium dendriticum]
MSSSIYILPGARTLSSLELADGRTGADSFHAEPNASEPSVPYDNNADPSVDLVGPLHLQLFAPQTMAYSQGTQELMHTVTDYTRVLPATPIPSWFRMYAQTGGGHLPGMENETNSGYHEQESKPHLTDALAHTQVFDQNAIQSEYTTFSAALGEHTETQPSHSNYSVTKTAVRPASACLPFDGTAKMEPGATVHAILFTDGENIPHPSTTASQKETFSEGKVSYDR